MRGFNRAICGLRPTSFTDTPRADSFPLRPQRGRHKNFGDALRHREAPTLATVEGLRVMPDVRDQDTASPTSKLVLYTLDEIPTDAPAFRPLRDDQFA